MNCHDGGQRKLKLFVMGMLLAIGFAMLLNAIVGKIFYINTTDSAPKGIYMVALNQHVHYGDYVIAALPVDVPLLQVPKGFLLLKQVRGLAGDSYYVSEDVLEIQGKTYKIFSRCGLPHLEAGEKVVAENEVMLLNEWELSFDSRYLGPIEEERIVTKVEMLLPYEIFNSVAPKEVLNERS